jgi:hypothetical protein
MEAMPAHWPPWGSVGSRRMPARASRPRSRFPVITRSHGKSTQPIRLLQISASALPLPRPAGRALGPTDRGAQPNADKDSAPCRGLVKPFPSAKGRPTELTHCGSRRYAERPLLPFLVEFPGTPARLACSLEISNARGRTSRESSRKPGHDRKPPRRVPGYGDSVRPAYAPISPAAWPARCRRSPRCAWPHRSSPGTWFVRRPPSWPRPGSRPRACTRARRYRWSATR